MGKIQDSGDSPKNNELVSRDGAQLPASQATSITESTDHNSSISASFAEVINSNHSRTRTTCTVLKSCTVKLPQLSTSTSTSVRHE